jgi:hypothetical protein
MSLTLVLVVAGCSDQTGPSPIGAQPSFAEVVRLTETHILRQSPTAPPLETYRVSFWARRDRASTVTVNYLPRSGQPAGEPFLLFYIPKRGLTSGPDRPHLHGRDSILITLTIDPDSFVVDFQPSGVVFDKRHRASLVLWYANANPDVNGDGAVDATDEALREQLAIWTRHGKQAPWHRLLSQTDPTLPFVFTQLRHFSQYAVSW